MYRKLPSAEQARNRFRIRQLPNRQSDAALGGRPSTLGRCIAEREDLARRQGRAERKRLGKRRNGEAATARAVKGGGNGNVTVSVGVRLNYCAKLLVFI